MDPELKDVKGDGKTIEKTKIYPSFGPNFCWYIGWV